MATPKKLTSSADDLEKKVFDIASPGTTEPSASGRPIITAHKPTVADPMLADGARKSEDTPEEDADQAPSKKGVIIEPIHKEIRADESEPIANEASTTEEGQKDTVDDKESEEISDLASQATAKKDALAKNEAEAAAIAQREELADRLVADKTYFVPINSVRKRKITRAALIIGVAVAVSVAIILWSMMMVTA